MFHCARPAKSAAREGPGWRIDRERAACSGDGGQRNAAGLALGAALAIMCQCHSHHRGSRLNSLPAIHLAKPALSVTWRAIPRPCGQLGPPSGRAGAYPAMGGRISWAVGLPCQTLSAKPNQGQWPNAHACCRAAASVEGVAARPVDFAVHHRADGAHGILAPHVRGRSSVARRKRQARRRFNQPQVQNVKPQSSQCRLPAWSNGAMGKPRFSPLPMRLSAGFVRSAASKIFDRAGRSR